jgi:hypothetical protein
MMLMPQNYNFARIIDVMINSERRGPGLYEVPSCLETFVEVPRKTTKNSLAHQCLGLKVTNFKFEPSKKLCFILN